MYKFADDTYFGYSNQHVQSRKTELNHVSGWAQKNNLQLNRAKYVKIIFRDKVS